MIRLKPNSYKKIKFISYREKVFEKKFGVNLPPLYSLFIKNFSTGINFVENKKCIDKFLCPSSLDDFNYKNNNFNVAFGYLSNFLEDHENIPYSIYIEKNQDEFLIIGYSGFQGHYLVGIKPHNIDNIYKIDIEFDDGPIFLANNIFEFFENFKYDYNEYQSSFILNVNSKYYENKSSTFDLNQFNIKNLEDNHKKKDKNYLKFIDLQKRLYQILIEVNNSELPNNSEPIHFNTFFNIVDDGKILISQESYHSIFNYYEKTNVLNNLGKIYDLIDKCEEITQDLEEYPFKFPLLIANIYFIPTLYPIILFFAINDSRIEIFDCIHINDFIKNSTN